MKPIRLVCLAVAIFAAAGAKAQDAAEVGSWFTAGVDAFGRSIGEAVRGSASILVTATGQAEPPAPMPQVFLMTIEGRSAAAVEAWQIREDRLKVAREVAQRFNVSVELGATTFTSEIDPGAQARRLAAERQAHPTPPNLINVPSDADRVFVARTGVRFRAAEPDKLPPFLDALKVAGVDSLSGARSPNVAPVMFRASEALGFDALATADEATLDRATQNAVEAARHQANVAAAAAGSQLGAATQILYLTRSALGGKVSVTVAVRFNLTPAK